MPQRFPEESPAGAVFCRISRKSLVSSWCGSGEILSREPLWNRCDAPADHESPLAPPPAAAAPSKRRSATPRGVGTSSGAGTSCLGREAGSPARMRPPPPTRPAGWNSARPALGRNSWDPRSLDPAAGRAPDAARVRSIAVARGAADSPGYLIMLRFGPPLPERPRSPARRPPPPFRLPRARASSQFARDHGGRIGHPAGPGPLCRFSIRRTKCSARPRGWWPRSKRAGRCTPAFP